MLSKDAQLSGRLNPSVEEPRQQQVEAPSAPEAAPLACSDSSSGKTEATEEASASESLDPMSCALCPSGLLNPFLAQASDADALDVLHAASEAALAANDGPAAAPASVDDFSVRDPEENSPYYSYPEAAFNALGFGFADHLGLADDNLNANSKAHYMSANCVVFTNYIGDAAAEVDQHFSRALGSLNKEQASGQAILGKPSVFDLKNKLAMGSSFSSHLTPCHTLSSKKNINSLQLPSGQYPSMNHNQRPLPWTPTLPPTFNQPQNRYPLPSYSAFNAYWSGQYHSVSCPNTPLQHPSAPGQQAFQFNSTITAGSDTPCSAVPQQRDYWY